MKNFELDNTPKIKSGFVTPENYFDTLSEKVNLKLAEPEVKVIPIFQKHIKILYAIAAILVLALMIPLFTPTPASEIDQATIENYIAYQSDISQYDLLTLLESEDIENISSDIEFDDEALESTLSASGNLELYLTE